LIEGPSNLNVLNQKKIMRRFKIVLAGLAVGCSLALSAVAQELVCVTNAPATIIENFELQTGTVIVKGFNLVGTITIGSGVISVRTKESNDVNHGQKVYGLALGWSGATQSGGLIPKNFMAVDYDELESFINGISYVSNVTYDVTSMSGFEASYLTKSGVRVSAHSDRRQGGINVFLQFGDWQRVQLNSDQLAQLKSLIVQAKASLDAIK
jgi:hypothetical protein